MVINEFEEKFMGQKVIFNQEFTRVDIRKYCDGATRIVSEWRPINRTPYLGWVVGIRWLQEGYTRDGSHNNSAWGDEYEPPQFIESGPRKVCYLVASSSRKNPIRVPPGSITLMLEMTHPTPIKE